MTDADDTITAPQRQRVRQLAGCGVAVPTIRVLAAPQLEMSEFTRIFAQDLTLGAAEADRHVAETLFELARSGKHLQATLAWARQRLGWSGENEAILHDTSSDTAESWTRIQELLDEYAAAKAAGTQPAREMAEDSAAQPVAAAG